MTNMLRVAQYLTIGLAAAAPAGAVTVSAEASAALLDALMDEYHAIAVYAELVDAYGTDSAFDEVLSAEEKHEAAIIRLLDKYEITVPENPYLDGTLDLGPLPASLVDAYSAGVAAEIANIDLYQTELLPLVAEYPDITKVFTALMTASQTNHLPTFEACIDGTCDAVAAGGTSKPETTGGVPSDSAQGGGRASGASDSGQNGSGGNGNGG